MNLGTLVAVVGVVWIGLEVFIALRPAPAGAVQQDRFSRVAISLAIFVGIFSAEFLARARLAPLPGGIVVWQAIGLVFMVSGIAVRFWAVAVLGRYFRVSVTIERDQHVVERGPYRVVRHPSYAGGLLGLLGFGLTFGDGLAVAALIILSTLGILRRILVEEQALAQSLGEPYRDYMRRTQRLIPGVF